MNVKSVVLFVVILLIVPFAFAYDSLVYMMTKPACLNCSTLFEFIKNSSLTATLFGTAGYTLGKKHKYG